ncbi:recombinase family protein [Clostridioides difficile]|uniref:recombinase family protein n=1 Tax=Clostridioides difficile TaxID=1496 RepID=UPI0010337828|nr:recombinase family protein [Clostridioides difficile]
MCRVSTKNQTDNNSLYQQQQEILNKYNDAKIIKETYTGTTTNRPKFEKIISSLKKGDLLVATKLDRLARSTSEGIQLIEGLFAKEVSVHILNIGLLENTSMGKFFLTTLLAVAELERNMIIERTQLGKEFAKKKKDFKDGRPKKYSNQQIQYALGLLNSKPYREVVKMTGISKSTLIRAKKSI